MIGARLDEGGEAAKRVTDMVEAAKNNPEAQALFSQGSSGARACQGRFEIDPAVGTTKVTSREMLDLSKTRRKEDVLEARKKKRYGNNSLVGASHVPEPLQTGWAALSSAEDRSTGLVEFTQLLTGRGFKADDIELIAVHGIRESCKFAQRVNGIYYRKVDAQIQSRACYQKLLHAPGAVLGICCDNIYMFYGEREGQSCWQIRFGLTDHSPIVAFCVSDESDIVAIKGTWQVQQEGNGDFAPDDALAVALRSED